MHHTPQTSHNSYFHSSSKDSQSFFRFAEYFFFRITKPTKSFLQLFQKMAFGRMRNNKRSSSSSNSYVSSITTVVFIALCVLGVWMLTSDTTVVTPKATTHASTTFTRDETNELVKPDDSRTFNKPNESGTFEDNPGDLPDDALKNGDPQKFPEDQKKSDQVSSKDFSTESNVGGSYQHNVQANEPKVDDNGNKVKENEPQVDENVHSLDGKESAEEHEKQNESQIQVSEESTLTEKQNIQQSAATDQESSKPKQQDQVEEIRGGDQRKSSDSGQISEEATQKNDNQQQEQQQGQEQEKKDNNQQTVEEQQQQQQQQQGEKPITYSDETKKDPSKKDSSEDLNTDQQDKSMGQQLEDEAAKQADPEQENNDSKGNKQGTAGSTEAKPNEPNSLSNSGIPKESHESKKSWSTQAAHSNDEKQRRKVNLKGKDDESLYGYTWQLCNVTAGYDYIPCLDNEKALKTLRTTKHFQHRERHCPEDPPTCLVPVPQGYKKPFQICSGIKRP